MGKRAQRVPRGHGKATRPTQYYHVVPKLKLYVYNSNYHQFITTHEVSQW
jgi:hypothetical protein